MKRRFPHRCRVQVGVPSKPFFLFRCTCPRHSCCSCPQVCVSHLTFRILSHRLHDVARLRVSVSVYLLPGTHVIRSRCGRGAWTRVTLYRSCDTGHSQSFDFVMRPKYSDPVRFSGVCGYHRLRRTGPWLTRRLVDWSNHSAVCDCPRNTLATSSVYHLITVTYQHTIVCALSFNTPQLRPTLPP